MKSQTYFPAVLKSDLKEINTGEIWVTSYTVHDDIVRFFFGDIINSIHLRVYVDGGGVMLSPSIGRGYEIVQSAYHTVHSKLILISQAERAKNSLLYILTGNLRFSLAEHVNHWTRIVIDADKAEQVRDWVQRVVLSRNPALPDKCLLACIDMGSGELILKRVNSIGEGILAEISREEISIEEASILGPWGSQKTINELCKKLKRLKSIDVYASCNYKASPKKGETWAERIHLPPSKYCADRQANLRLRWAIQRGGNYRMGPFVHTKAGIFSGSSGKGTAAFLYFGSANFTAKGFWGGTGKDDSGNIEVGVLYKSKEERSASALKSHFDEGIRGNRWGRLRVLKLADSDRRKRTAKDNGHSEDPVEEDDLLFGNDNFERRKLIKELNRVLSSREKRFRVLKNSLCDVYTYPTKAKKFLSVLNQVLQGRWKIERMGDTGIRVLERGEVYTRLAVELVPRAMAPVLVMVCVERVLLPTDAEIRKDFLALSSFGHIAKKKRIVKGRREKSTSIESGHYTNLRFPYHNFYLWKNALRKANSAKSDISSINEMIVAEIRQKIRTLDLLDRTCQGHPQGLNFTWWRSLFAMLLKEEGGL
jgi:hypothetical protein